MLRVWTVLLLVVALVGCESAPKPQPIVKGLDFQKELPPGQMALRKLSPADYPPFALDHAHVADLIASIDHSLDYLKAPSSKQYFPYLDIPHERAVATLVALRAVLSEPRFNVATGSYFNEQIREKFEVYQSVGAPNEMGKYTGRVLFTGYCTPIYAASLKREGPYQYPLYKRPADLVRNEITGQVQGRRQADGSIVPYYTRAEIEQQNVLAGQELIWLTSRFDAYVIHVQGSARLKLPDGRMLEIGYAGHNGYEYSSIGEQMVRDGAIKKEQLSLRGLREYFAAYPQHLPRYLSTNPRFVFFDIRPGGPFGSLGVPVTPFASIATDKSIFPRAMPAFVSTKIPTAPNIPFAPPGPPRDFSTVLLDQDTGGGIRAAGRCDIYMGVGEEAEHLAGQQLFEGQLYYLALRSDLVPQFSGVPGLRVPQP